MTGSSIFIDHATIEVTSNDSETTCSLTMEIESSFRVTSLTWLCYCGARCNSKSYTQQQLGLVWILLPGERSSTSTMTCSIGFVLQCLLSPSMDNTSLAMITLHLSLSWAELEPLLSHDHAHAWSGSPGQACSRIVLVHQIHKASIRISPCSINSFFLLASALLFRFCFDLRKKKCFFLTYESILIFVRLSITTDSHNTREIRSIHDWHTIDRHIGILVPLVLPFLFAPPRASHAKSAAPGFSSWTHFKRSMGAIWSS